MTSPKHIVVIGGGITGLTAAYNLMKHKSDVALRCTVLEQDARFGGKVMTHQEHGVMMEAGPDSILRYKPAGVALIKELGLESEVIEPSPLANKVFILHKGRLLPLPAKSQLGLPTDVAPFIRSKLMSFRGKLRALLDFVLPSNVKGDGDIALGTLLRYRFGNELITNIAEPLLGGIHAGGVDNLSTAMTFPQILATHKKHNSIARGFRAQAKSATTNRGQSGSRQSAFLSLKGGLETLIAKLVSELTRDGRVALETGSKVMHVSKESGTYHVLVEHGASKRTLVADAVILAVPAHVGAKMLAPLSKELEKRLECIPYHSTATVLLGYSKEEWITNIQCSGFLVPSKENRLITACTMFSDKWPLHARGDLVLVRCYVGRGGEQSFLELTDESLVGAVHQELQDILGIKQPPVFQKIYRFKDAMPQYLPHHLNRIEDLERELRTCAPGVMIAGAGYRGSGIPDCITQGRRASDEILAYLQRGGHG